MVRIIDDMPSLGQIEAASAEDIVRWHLFLRPTMTNDELNNVKFIARKYEAIPPERREALTAKVRREHQ